MVKIKLKDKTIFASLSGNPYQDKIKFTAIVLETYQKLKHGNSITSTSVDIGKEIESMEWIKDENKLYIKAKDGEIIKKQLIY